MPAKKTTTPRKRSTTKTSKAKTARAKKIEANNEDQYEPIADGDVLSEPCDETVEEELILIANNSSKAETLDVDPREDSQDECDGREVTACLGESEDGVYRETYQETYSETPYQENEAHGPEVSAEVHATINPIDKEP